MTGDSLFNDNIRHEKLLNNCHENISDSCLTEAIHIFIQQASVRCHKCQTGMTLVPLSTNTK